MPSILALSASISLSHAVSSASSLVLTSFMSLNVLSISVTFFFMLVKSFNASSNLSILTNNGSAFAVFFPCFTSENPVISSVLGISLIPFPISQLLLLSSLSSASSGSLTACLIAAWLNLSALSELGNDGRIGRLDGRDSFNFEVGISGRDGNSGKGGNSGNSLTLLFTSFLPNKPIIIFKNRTINTFI